MAPEQKRPWKICRVGGRSFEIYREYDELVGYDVGIYPDFRENPEYTDEGRPFATATDEACPHGRPGKPEEAEPGAYCEYGDCGGCAFFRRDETPWDIIGVCMCDARRRGSDTK